MSDSGGKQTTRCILARSAAAVRVEVAECRRQCRLIAKLIEVSERLSDARLKGTGPDAVA